MFRILRPAIACVLVLAAAATVSASTDIFLKLEGAGKVVATSSVAADGSFRFERIPDGAYFVEFAIDGRTYSTASTAASKGGPTAPIQVSTARESGSGMASGRRMHKPFVITKEWGAASPKLMVTIDGSTVQGRVDVPRTTVEN